MTAPYKKSAIALQDEVAAEAYKKMFKMYAKLPLAEQNANSSDLEATKRLYHNQGSDALKSIVQMQKVFKALGAPPVAPWEPRLPRLPRTPAHRTRHLTPSTSTFGEDASDESDESEGDDHTGYAGPYSPYQWTNRLRPR